MKRIFITLMLMTIMVFSVAMVVTADDDPVSVDVDSWKSPVKDVLKANGVELGDVELQNKTYYILYVTFPKPLALENQAYFEKVIQATAGANKFQSFKMEDSDNEIVIQVECQASKIAAVTYNESANYFADLKAMMEKQKVFSSAILKAVPELSGLTKEIAKNNAKMVIKIEAEPSAEGENKYEKEYYLMNIVQLKEDGEEVYVDECRISADAKDIVWYDEDNDKYLTVVEWQKKIQTAPYCKLD